MFKASRNLLKKEKGVTLVELLAVIIILGIIALIAVPAIAGVIEDSKVDSVKASGIGLIDASDLYLIANGEDSAGTIEYGNLDNYLTDDGVTWTSTPVISVSGSTVSISGEATIDGVSVTFTNATKTSINNADNVVDGGEITSNGVVNP